MDPAVFVDRDNTLIANDGDLGDPGAVDLLGGVAGGLKALRRAGFRIVVVSNQGGVARGAFTEDDVDAVHQRIAAIVDGEAQTKDVISRFYYCPYHPEGVLEAYRREHPWRKPQPGMLLQAARDMNIDLARSWMIGDQPRDVQAGRSAGCRTIRITDGSEAGEENGAADATLAVATFPEAVQAILRSGPPRGPASAHDPPPGGGGGGGGEPTPERDARGGGGAPSDPPARGDASADRLHRAIESLSEHVRSEQLRRAEFTGFRLAAGMCQLLAVLLALLGLLQLGSTDVFLKWMIGAVMAQLVTISILLLDLKA
jgi:D-glycero-D-manno-heptose 1,7-bisphosphate phosphatase